MLTCQRIRAFQLSAATTTRQWFKDGKLLTGQYRRAFNTGLCFTLSQLHASVLESWSVSTSFVLCSQLC